MSILINMEMPKRCEDCTVCYKYETVTAIACGCKINMRTREIGCVTRPDWCPLIEVPEHGRLIDADKMIEKYEELIERSKDSVIHMTYHDVIVEAIYDLKQAPTVIPADKDGET